jgi:excisionase family DNA binding protein
MNEAQTIAANQLAGSTEEFSVTELANLLQLHAATIRLWLREDRLPGARKDGRKWLIRGDDVARLLAENPTLGYAHPRDAQTGIDASVVGERRRRAEVGPRALGAELLERGLP